ncbi:MAG TPA: ATP-binding protein [Anaeromyxobacteraceae bacterium]|nr:ATP-binding protein [Anaeromyxobacteraceae bacterium]
MPLPSRILAALRRAASPGARVWVLPNLVLGLFAIALFALLAVLGRHETETRRNALARDVQWAEQTIRTRLAANEDFLQLLAKEVAEERQDADSSSRRAAEHVAANPELTQVAWIDADQVVRWVAPRETTAWNRGERLSIPEQALAFQRAQRTGTPAYSMPAPAADESASIEIHVPVFRDRLFRGVVVGIYAADAVLRYLSSSWFWNKYRVVMETDDRVVAANSSVVLRTDLTELVRLDPPGQGLRLRVSAFADESNLPRDMLLLLIIGLVLLMGWSLWTLSAHMRRRLAAEEGLRRESAFRQAMEESVITGLRAVDMQGRITYVNPAFCGMVGWSADELIGLVPPFPYWPEEELATLERVTATWMGGQSPPSGFEVRIRRKTGERFFGRMYISPLVGADGRQAGWMASMVDITEQKRARAELEASHQKVVTAQERLQQTSRLVTMGEMASSIAHELNQPLAAIANYCMGCVTRLESGAFSPDDLASAMRKASDQAERAGKIIRRIRDFVKKREPNRAPVPVAVIVDEAIGFAEIDARKAGVNIRLEVPQELPPVFADKIMIEQVVLNLVKNGIEAMHGSAPGRRELTVSARVDEGRAVEVAVADRGHGITPEQSGRLFAPFYTTKLDGMGMGLNICRSIVEFHDGRLWARPNDGGGSVFVFTLPVER